MAVPTPNVTAAYRPFNNLVTLAFASLSIGGLWMMRIKPALEGVPVNFDRHLEMGVHDDGTTSRTVYIGLADFDTVLQTFVMAFIPGVARWDEGIWLQQMHFIVNFTSVLVIMTVEACRRRNAWRVVYFTTIWGFLYQTVAGAAIVPLYYLAFMQASSPADYYISGREVPMSYAKAILPASFLGFVVPTLALWFYPWADAETMQAMTAVWQLAPIYVNILLLIFSSFSSSAPAKSKNADTKYLKAVYLMAAAVSFIAHIDTLYIFFTSTNPQLSLNYVFWPNSDMWKLSTALGLHWMFQVDYLVILVASLLFGWVAALDIERLLGRKTSVPFIVVVGLSLVAHVAIIGPGATLAALWYWRENRLMEIEEGDSPGVAGKTKKG